MLGLRRRGRPTKSSPAPPRTFPDGTPFPGEVHRRTIAGISRFACETGAPRHEAMVRRAVMVDRLLCQPNSVELTTDLVADLGSGCRWLEANGGPSERRDYQVVLTDLGRYWDQSGALQLFRDSLK